KEMRRESANDIGARSVKAAIKPDIKLQPTDQHQNNGSLANGMRSYNPYGRDAPVIQYRQ
ncbi:hypothetical protein KKJ09_02870, partial [Xenorhabdus bovienii]|uniref:hypothetical protein n=1 Tax=Xenorhabdus bovienii TaxID=40576 RepID=UPI0023B2EB0F